MITFDYPLVLLGYAVFVPLILLDCCSPCGRRIAKNLPKNLRIKLYVSRIFLRVFLSFTIIAMAGPRWGMSLAANEYRRALDAAIAIDVSRSMETVDGQAGTTSRLERGMAIVKEAVAAMPGTRFAVALSRNRGIVAIPFTWDSGVVLGFMDAAGSSITGRGTNLESLLDAAADAFQPSHPSARVILLVSDGEALSGSLEAAVARCGRNDISVVSVAVGSDEGGIVPATDDIVSYRNLTTMRMAAAQTGGICVDGNSEDAARTLILYLRSLAPESAGGGNRTERTARWPVFIMLAIMAFGASKLSLLRGKEKAV